MSPCSQWGHAALTFLPRHLEEMGQMIKEGVSVLLFLNVFLSLCPSYYLFSPCCRKQTLNKRWPRWQKTVFRFTSLENIQSFGGLKSGSKSSLGNTEVKRHESQTSFLGDNKCVNHQILIRDRLPATAAGTLCHIWMLLQQMDQRCAVHSKSGTLNNSATSCVTLTAV